MPIYQYTCESCRKIKEIEASMDDADKIKCPKCPKCKEKMIRVFGAPVRFLGRGWPQKENKRYKGCEYMDTHMPRPERHYGK